MPIVMIVVSLIVGFTASAWAQAKTGWEQEWNQILAAGKKEGRVVVMGSADPIVRRDLPPKFRERFGIEVEYLGGRAGDNTTKLRMERRAGVFSVDVIFAGVSTLGRELYPVKILDPLRPALILPDVVDASKWKGGKLWFVDPEEQYILRLYNYVSSAGLAINTRHVKGGEFKSVHELLDPKWKGKISLRDPTDRSSDVQRLYQQFGPEFVKKLYVDQKPGISRNKRELADWLGRGIYPVSYGAVDTEAVIAMKKLDLPVEVINVPDLKGGLSAGNGSIALLNGAPHPNAARVFANWAASKEGVEFLGQARKKPTTRADIDESYALSWEMPQPGIDYIDNHSWEAIQDSELWKAEMKELLKHGTWR